MIMEKILVGSVRKSAGKTSLIVGIAKALGKSIGYIKPYGDRIIYQRKRLWDYDASLVAGIFGLKELPEEMSLGFDPSKLRYMYDGERLRKRLDKMVAEVEVDKEIVFVETGKDIGYGVSIGLDVMSLVEYIGGKLIFVISGDDEKILDDVGSLKKFVDLDSINFGGVIINQVRQLDEFKDFYLRLIDKQGIKVLGIVPYREELRYFSVEYLADRLFAKVIAGESMVKNTVKNVVIGALSTSAVLRYPPFYKENTVIITGGDRNDLIIASLENKNIVGIVLTGNMMPDQGVVAQAEAKNIPLLLVATDTLQIARQTEDMELLLTKDDIEKIDMWKEIAEEHIKIGEITSM